MVSDRELALLTGGVAAVVAMTLWLLRHLGLE